MARPTRAAASKRRVSIVESDTSVIVISDSDDSDAFEPPASPLSSPPGSPVGESESDSEPEPEPVVVSDSDSEGSSSKPRGRGTKRKRGTAVGPKKPVKKEGGEVDIEDCVPRPHARAYHGIDDVVKLQDELLGWFETVRDERGMPWRKRYDAAASREDKAQRAYEVWVSEVMLQQTQVATVIDYWTRWIARWPTVQDLARADIEEVNAAWRGLGYYRRAKSLLDGAKTVVETKRYEGQLPSDPEALEKGIPGVGRYTAGAICSITYGVRTPIVDGNIHRVLTRLLAVHATQTAPSTIKFLWDTAAALVDALPRGLSRGVAGDWNQALMELGATVCKPVNPDCDKCPLKDGCKALKEVSASPPPPPPGAECDLCEAVPCEAGATTIPSVTVFPMRKAKKASREENEVVVVTEWRGKDDAKRWLLVKRPEKGLLAGLFEPPTTPVPLTATVDERLHSGHTHLSTLLDTPSLEPDSHTTVDAVPHIFSHINMTYHVQHLVLTSDDAAPPDTAATAARPMVWLDAQGVEAANVGTGVKKVWAAVYGKWGHFEPAKAKTGKPKPGKPKAQKPKLSEKQAAKKKATKKRAAQAKAAARKAKAQPKKPAAAVKKEKATVAVKKEKETDAVKETVAVKKENVVVKKEPGASDNDKVTRRVTRKISMPVVKLEPM